MICFPWEREVGDPSVLEASDVDGATSSWCQAPPPCPLTSQLHHKATNPIPGQPLVVVGALFCLSFLGMGQLFAHCSWEIMGCWGGRSPSLCIAWGFIVFFLSGLAVSLRCTCYCLPTRWHTPLTWGGGCCEKFISWMIHQSCFLIHSRVPHPHFTALSEGLARHWILRRRQSDGGGDY